jgi:transcriptional regulator with XRE-family HTH domain
MGVSLRNRPADTGKSRARFLRHRLAEELRLARVTAGLTQSQLARRAGISQALVSLAERGGRGVSLEVASQMAASAGCELGLRVYAGDGVRLRDSGQLAIAESILGAAHPSWHPRLEQPISRTDRRAADVVLEGAEEVIHLEIERRLVDFQAQLRAAMLKRDALTASRTVPVRLIIVLPDRRSNREALRRVSSPLERAMPLISARFRRSIVTGEPLGSDGLVLWRISASKPGDQSDTRRRKAAEIIRPSDGNGRG